MPSKAGPEILSVQAHHVRAALQNLLAEFETAGKAQLSRLPPALAMLRPMLEQALGGGVFHDQDGSMGDRFWLYLKREVLQEATTEDHDDAHPAAP